jgi:hypothetical protein
MVCYLCDYNVTGLRHKRAILPLWFSKPGGTKGVDMRYIALIALVFTMVACGSFAQLITAHGTLTVGVDPPASICRTPRRLRLLATLSGERHKPTHADRRR